MKNKLLAAALCLLAFSCNKKETPAKDDSATVTIQENTAAKVPLELDTFAFPADIQGCSCYFAKNKQDFEAQKYIYADDYGNNAVVKIAGKTIKFPMKEGDFDPSHFSKTLDNGEYKLEMKAEKTSDSDEAMVFEGQITITDRKGNHFTTPIFGECGC